MERRVLLVCLVNQVCQESTVCQEEKEAPAVLVYQETPEPLACRALVVIRVTPALAVCQDSMEEVVCLVCREVQEPRERLAAPVLGLRVTWDRLASPA